MFVYVCPYCGDVIRPILIELGKTVEYKGMLFCSPTCLQIWKEVGGETQNHDGTPSV